MPLDLQILGAGVYSPREAGRFAGVSGREIRRWTKGTKLFDPLWRTRFSAIEGSSEISFIDMLESRVVAALRRAGVSMQAIRFAIAHAQEVFGIEKPLSSEHFRTDGREILIDAIERDGELVSLSKMRAGQKVFGVIVKQSLVDIEFEEARPVRWRPSAEVVVDPERAFGDPMLDAFGISTSIIREEAEQLGSPQKVASLYEIPVNQVRSAIAFENFLDGQSSV